jgi:hypothetical protein
MPNQGAPKPVRSNRLYETVPFFFYIPGSNCQTTIIQSLRDKGNLALSLDAHGQLPGELAIPTYALKKNV